MTIGVFFGGKSPEHEISIITGELIISELKKNHNYQVIPIYLNKEGEWFIDQKLGFLEFFKNKEKILNNFGKYFIDLEESRGKIVFRAKKLFSKKIVIDLAFPAFHGTGGEDGTIQGLFEIFNIPYIGCNVATSSIAMDKILTKSFYQAHNISTTKFLYFNKIDWQENKKNIINNIEKKLRYPLFVKPPKLGSSIGISKATNLKEMELGVEVALHYGERCLIEEAVENLVDITCAVKGNDYPTTSLIQESVFSSDFFNYEEKYLKDGGVQTGNASKNIIIPARLSEEMTIKIKNMAIDIYKKFGCSGIARIDFLYDKAYNLIYANEINTIPGTLYHHLWKASGINFEDLLNELILLAIEKNKKDNSYQYIFESNILNQINSLKLKK